MKAERLDAGLAAAMLIGWTVRSGPEAISKQFVFPGFTEAWSWMCKVADEVKRLDHHPEWFNVYNRVEVTLTTHASGGVSMKDVELGAFMDSASLR